MGWITGLGVVGFVVWISTLLAGQAYRVRRRSRLVSKWKAERAKLFTFPEDFDREAADRLFEAIMASFDSEMSWVWAVFTVGMIALVLFVVASAIVGG